MVTLIAIFIFFVVMDQLSKTYAVDLLGSIGNSAEFLPGFIRFEYYQNTGMAWGLFPNAQLIFIILTIVLSAAIIYFIAKYKEKMPILTKLALTLVLSGAVGNLIDRMFLGYVRDFIAFDFFEFPVFNIADSCVTVGAILLIISLVFLKSGKEFMKIFDAPKVAQKKEDNETDE